MRYEVLKLHPTQFSVGIHEINRKVRVLEKLRRQGKLTQHLDANPIPVVRGPQDKLYVLDHHHLARACWEIGVKKVRVEIKKDLSYLKSERSFWRRMILKKRVYLVDEFGRSGHKPVELPHSVRGLADDPFRGFASEVQLAGGFKKTSVLFSDFTWANFFRRHMRLEEIRADFEQAVRKGCRLARTPKAKKLPGYVGK